MADDFLTTYAPLANDIATRTGVDPSVVLGIIDAETGGGRRVSGNNIFGISPGGRVAGYPDVQTAANAFISLMQTPRYRGVAAAGDPASQAAALVKGGYNTVNPAYATIVANKALNFGKQLGYQDNSGGGTQSGPSLYATSSQPASDSSDQSAAWPAAAPGAPAPSYSDQPAPAASPVQPVPAQPPAAPTSAKDQVRQELSGGGQQSPAAQPSSAKDQLKQELSQPPAPGALTGPPEKKQAPATDASPVTSEFTVPGMGPPDDQPLPLSRGQGGPPPTATSWSSWRDQYFPAPDAGDIQPDPRVTAAIGRVGQAAAEGWQGGTMQTPEAYAGNQGTWVGRNVVNPLVEVGNLPFRAMGALGRGGAQAIYEAGEPLGRAMPEIRIPDITLPGDSSITYPGGITIDRPGRGFGGTVLGGPGLGRDLNLLSQVVPVASDMRAPGAMGPPVAPEVNALRPQYVSERMAPPRPPGMTDLERMQQLIAHDEAERAGVSPQPPSLEGPSASSGVSGGGPTPSGGGGGGWRPVQSGEVFQPGQRFRMNQTTGVSEVYEPSAAATGLADLGGAAQAIGGNLRDMLWDKLQRGDTTELGRPSQILIDAKAAMDQGAIQNRSDFDAWTQQWGAQQRAARGTATPETAAAGAQVTTEPIPEKTKDQKATDIRKDVAQTATNRAGPALKDDNSYFDDPNNPIPPRPQAYRDFSPQTALDHKYYYSKDTDYRAGVDEIDRQRNTGMTDSLRAEMGDANTRRALKEVRDEVTPDAMGVFKDEKPVDPGLLEGFRGKVQGLLDGPFSKRGKIRSILEDVYSTLFDKNGNIETLPSKLQGVRDNMTDWLDLKSGSSDTAKAVQAGQHVITGLVDDLNPVMNSGAPKWDQWRAEWAKRSQAINQQDFLQNYEPGRSKSLWDGQGNLQYRKVQQLVADIANSYDKPVHDAHSLTDAQIQRIVQVRNELAAKDLARVQGLQPGSPTHQLFERAAKEGGTTLGRTLGRMGAEYTAHAIGAYAASRGIPGVNAAIGMYQSTRPLREQRKAARRSATLEEQSNALKASLLEQRPYNPLQP